MKPAKIIIAGGGSGGHIFPGVALADQLMKKNSATKVLFVGNGTPLEKKILETTKYPFFSISEMNAKKKRSTLKSIKKLPLSLLKAKNLLENFEPHLVIGVGGYPSVPVGIMSRIKGIPIVVCEQNILPGRANRLLFRIADRIYKSFEYTIGLENNSKAIFSGNPIRENILNGVMWSTPRKTGRKITVLVLGGSQGAHAINIAVTDALKHIDKNHILRFIHQSGPEDKNMVKEKYQSEKTDSVVKSFFNNMSSYYNEADIVICRAGATTISELTAIGKCSLLIPYPFSEGNHQLINAQYLEEVGGSKIFHQEELNEFNIAKYINKLTNDQNKIKEMALNAKTVGVCNAAETIVNDISIMLEKKKCF